MPAHRPALPSRAVDGRLLPPDAAPPRQLAWPEAGVIIIIVVLAGVLAVAGFATRTTITLLFSASAVAVSVVAAVGAETPRRILTAVRTVLTATPV